MATDEHVTQVRASHHSLSGCRHGEKPRHSLLDRATAAHNAGISDIGACADDLGDWAPHELHKLVRHHGVTVAELEWVDLSEPRSDGEDTLMRMADIFGSRQLNVGVCDPNIISDGWLARLLKLLARQAADHNLTVAFEPVAFGSVGDISRVQHIIEAANEPNVGTMLDSYHWARSGSVIRDVWPELVRCVQISGLRVKPVPSWPQGMFRESQCDRRMPDEGDFLIGEWLTALDEHGVDPAKARLSVEVISDEQRRLSLLDAAARITETAQQFAAQWGRMS